MAAVRHGTCGSPGIVFDHSIVSPPTDVMAITSLPKAGDIHLKGNRRPDGVLGGSFQVAGGGPRWRVAGIIHSAFHSVLHAVLNSVLFSTPTPSPNPFLLTPFPLELFHPTAI